MASSIDLLFPHSFPHDENHDYSSINSFIFTILPVLCIFYKHSFPQQPEYQPCVFHRLHRGHAPVRNCVKRIFSLLHRTAHPLPLARHLYHAPTEHTATMPHLRSSIATRSRPRSALTPLSPALWGTPVSPAGRRAACRPPRQGTHCLMLPCERPPGRFPSRRPHLSIHSIRTVSPSPLCANGTDSEGCALLTEDRQRCQLPRHRSSAAPEQPPRSSP